MRPKKIEKSSAIFRFSVFLTETRFPIRKPIFRPKCKIWNRPRPRSRPRPRIRPRSRSRSRSRPRPASGATKISKKPWFFRVKKNQKSCISIKALLTGRNILENSTFSPAKRIGAQAPSQIKDALPKFPLGLVLVLPHKGKIISRRGEKKKRHLLRISHFFFFGPQFR